ncbi:MAG: hypothetical protein ACK5V4_00060, partial [Alphaproteobacteria bacterium]
NKTPKIGLIDVDQDYFAIRSKYLKDAKTFNDHTQDSQATVEGFEKVIAACFYMSDADFHGENLMVHQDENGKYVFDKIDHGRSLAHTYDGIDHLFNANIQFIYRTYGAQLSSNQISFNYEVFKNELRSMRERLSPEVMCDIIDAKLSQLKKIGVEFNEAHNREIENLKRKIQTHDERIAVILGILEIGPTDLSSLKIPTLFTEIKQQNLKTIENAVQSSIAINSSLHGMDPIKFALLADIQIDNKTAIEYAIENNKKIDGMDPIEFCVVRQITNHIPNQKPLSLIKSVQNAVKNGEDIHGMDPIKFAIIAGIQIDSKPAIEYAVNKHKSIDGFNPIAFAVFQDLQIESKHPVKWAIEHKQKIDQQNPILWAVSQKESIDNQDPILWAIQNNKTIRGLDAWEYAYTHSLPIRGMEAIKWASSSRHKIQGVDPILFAFNNGLTIDNKSPLEWAITMLQTIEGMNATFAIDKLGLKIDGKSAIEWLLDNDKHGRYIKNAWNYANNHQEKIQGVEAGVWFIIHNQDIIKRTAIFNDIVKQIVNGGTLLPQGFEQNYTKQQKVELLSSMLELYSKLDPIKNADLMNVIKQDYNHIIEDINQSKSVVTLESSGFNKSTSEKIAHKLEKLIKRKDIVDVEINSSALLQKCDFDMALKVIEIGKILDNPMSKSSNPLERCAEQISKIFNKMVTSKHLKVTTDNINTVLSVISADELHPVYVENKEMSSFAQKIAAGRDTKLHDNSRKI